MTSAIAASVIAKTAIVPSIVRSRPNASIKRGARKTDVSATARPQPKNTKPSWSAPKFMPASVAASWMGKGL